MPVAQSTRRTGQRAIWSRSATCIFRSRTTRCSRASTSPSHAARWSPFSASAAAARPRCCAIWAQLKPSHGSVSFDGQVVHELNSRELYAMRRKMGMMFQVSGLFSDLSVFDNIAYPMREHTDLPEDVITTCADEAACGRPARRACLRTGELSGGMERAWRWPVRSRSIHADHVRRAFAGLDPISLNTSPPDPPLNDALG